MELTVFYATGTSDTASIKQTAEIQGWSTKALNTAETLKWKNVLSLYLLNVPTDFCLYLERK